jgi:molybdopterin/thiamine biosynthesis adenylyltransferase
MTDWTDDQLERYSRHILLPEVGGVGQEKLLAASVLVVGAGGLGAPMLQYLAAAGVGRIGVIDADTVDLSNLQRQVIHRTQDVGVPKAESAARMIRDLNPDVQVDLYQERITAANALAIIRKYQIVADGTDNFPTRYLLNDACHLAGRTLVSGALLRFEGQLSVFKSHLGEPHPCYRCLFPEPPAPGSVPSCSEAGVFGAVAGAVGVQQAVEVLKEILGLGDSLSGRFMMYDGLHTEWQNIRLRRNPRCPLCGDAPAIRDLSGHG